jgi:hypothetical protein
MRRHPERSRFSGGAKDLFLARWAHFDSRRLPIPLPASTLQVFQFIRWLALRNFDAHGWDKA